MGNVPDDSSRMKTWTPNILILQGLSLSKKAETLCYTSRHRHSLSWRLQYQRKWTYLLHPWHYLRIKIFCLLVEFPPPPRYCTVLYIYISGGSDSLLLGVWGLCSLELFLLFTCNLNAILLAPNFDTPVDTACQVVQYGLVPHSLYYIWTSLRNSTLLTGDTYFQSYTILSRHRSCRRFNRKLYVMFLTQQNCAQWKCLTLASIGLSSDILDRTRWNSV